MNFSIIIPVYGQWELTKNCLLSLKKEVHIPFEIIFVDNGAIALPDCKASIEAPILGKELFGDNFIYLGQEKNLNFSKACNLGARTARTDLLFFLNSDTLLLPNCIEPLLDAMQKDNSMKMIAPILLYPPNDKIKNYTIQHLGVAISPLNEAIHLYEHFPVDHAVVQKERKLQALTAAACMISKENFLKFDGFDEDFINGFEDLDFCGRFHKAGGIFEIIPQSHIVHLCSQSIGRGACNDHNTMVLAQKEGRKALVCDYEDQLKADGYELRLDPYAQLAPTCSHALAGTLDETLATHSLSLISNLYEREPYWHEGLWALLKHKDCPLREKISLITKAIKFYIEPRAYLEYLKITASLIELSSAEINALLSENFKFNIDINKDISEQKDFQKARLDALEAFMTKPNISQNLKDDCLYHIKNNAQFLDDLQKEIEILRTLAK